jgi:hypothetical protein
MPIPELANVTDEHHAQRAQGATADLQQFAMNPAAANAFIADLHQMVPLVSATGLLYTPDGQPPQQGQFPQSNTANPGGSIIQQPQAFPNQVSPNPPLSAYFPGYGPQRMNEDKASRLHQLPQQQREQPAQGDRQQLHQPQTVLAGHLNQNGSIPQQQAL